MHIGFDLFATALELFIVLGFMVLVHEFGHFVAAKLCGVRVETFSIGFGPRLFGVKRGNTDYRLSLLPLGGYVKMAGDLPGESTILDPGEFNAHSRWQRTIIALAGPFANFLLTFVLLTVLGLFHNEYQAFRQGPAVADYVPVTSPVAATGLKAGDTVVRFDHYNNPTWEDVLDDSLTHLNQTIQFSYVHGHQRVETQLPLAWKRGGPETFDPAEFGFVPKEQEAPMQVSRSSIPLMANMPGAQAGLRPGDILIAFDSYTPHSVHALTLYLQDQHGAPLALHILRDDRPMTLNVTPVYADRGSGTKAYQIGFLPLPPPMVVKNLRLAPAIVEGLERSCKYASLVVDVIGGMLTHRVSVRSLAGPIGIGKQVHQALAIPGWAAIVELMAFISVNLGILNLLPIPILDGGMIGLLVVEAFIRRDVNQSIKERVYQVAFVCLMVFTVFVIFNDISRVS